MSMCRYSKIKFKEM